MPRIKRWFPVSQDINGDVELWEFTDKFGDRSLRVWLEVLSIADRNDGYLPGPWKGYPKLLAGRCKSTTRHLVEVCQWLTRWLAIDSEGVARISNYAKYHRTPEHKTVPSEPSEPSEPSFPKETKAKKAATPDGFAEFWSLYPKKKSKGDAEKAWRAIQPNAELLVLILRGVQRGKASHDWLKQSGQFIPYPATWIRAKGWEDEGINFSSSKKANGLVALKSVEKKPTPEEIEKRQAFLRDTIKGLSKKMDVK